MGAWIEIHLQTYSIMVMRVAPLVGAWIEIYQCKKCIEEKLVAPLVGAWIEITSGNLNVTGITSLPSWERGLKSYVQGC